MKSIFFACVIGFTFVGCNNQFVLRQSAIETYNLTFEDLNNIQFRNSYDIVLTKNDAQKTDKATEKGNLLVHYDNQQAQVLIKANTKGRIVKDLGDGKYAVSFEPDDSKYLVFGKSEKFEVYNLQAIEWKNGRGKVKYGDDFYLTQSGADACTLRFKLKRKFRMDRDVRIAKGNKVK